MIGAKGSLVLCLLASSSLALSQVFYVSYCGSCHMPDARGIPGLYPPLTHIAAYLCHVEVRTYMTRVILYGLVGFIEVGGVQYGRASPYMPSFGFLDSMTVAKILNDLLRLLKLPYKPFSPQEVDRSRRPFSDPNHMRKERQALFESQISKHSCLIHK